MATNTRFLRIEKDEVVNSRARAPEGAVVPVFNHIGPLEVGVSGEWPVTQRMELHTGTLTAGSVGITSAYLVLMMKNAFNPGGEVLKTITLASTATLKNFVLERYLRPVIVGPGDLLYVASFTNSQHTNVVVQLHGTLTY